jgi:hypothetical protein
MVRFKNQKGIDAVSAHNALLESRGRVFWGLWLKEFENKRDIESRLNKLGSALEQIYVADTTQKSDPIIYVATVVRVVTESAQVNGDLVPGYYADDIAKVPIWFELSSKLIKVDIDSRLGEDW